MTPTFDFVTTALSSGIVVIIGSIPPLIGYLIKLNQRIINLERETPIAINAVKTDIAAVKSDVAGVLSSVKEMGAKLDGLAFSIARMEGRSEGIAQVRSEGHERQ